MILDNSIFLILTSIVVSSGLNFWFIKLRKFDAINHRSVHRGKATKTGGVGVFITLFIFSFYFYLNNIEIYDFSFLIPLGIMFIVGVYDDFYNADFKLKFFLQIIVAKILIDQGLIIDDFHGVLGLNEIPRLASQLFTVFVFLVIVNSFNFIDGIDGLAMTEAIKVILLIEFLSNKYTPFFNLGMITVLCLLPLYYFNYKVGSIFLNTSSDKILEKSLVIDDLWKQGRIFSLKLLLGSSCVGILLALICGIIAFFIYKIKSKR